MKILLLGSGGREHALYWKLSQEDNLVFTAPGNAGIPSSINVDWFNFSAILEYIQHNNIDLVISGPEGPLASGMGNFLRPHNIPFFGPDQEGAQLESSKIWAKKFMSRNGVQTARFWSFVDGDFEAASSLLRELKGNCVVKYDGLACGKGVFVCSSMSDAETALHAMDNLSKKYSHSHSPYQSPAFLIEEKISGIELSITIITDGKNYQMLLPTQDHKTLCESNVGPNTGGMGAIGPLPLLTPQIYQEIISQIVEPTIIGLNSENIVYKGFLYFGVMLTKNGPYLLEYNVRLGDPEAEVIIPAMKGKLTPLILNALQGKLENHSHYESLFSSRTYINVVFASDGYPSENLLLNHEIKGLKDLAPTTNLFFSGVKSINDKFYNHSGRVLSITCEGETPEAAINHVYQECERISFKGMHFRRDIGKYIQ
ncbi:MAG: phosphoribosylamine--glycine ligase [Oligoflexia bacterium]|nr:phosphoribosylamine--glycine ligase [Oligoflexia bacterium]MBF0364658.1 phosphoribosylamine--glycine ligase [Oligoflexia bacterium]